MNYEDTYSSWESDPENFWMEAAKAIDWYKFPSRALNKGREPFYSWYSDGEVNKVKYNMGDFVKELK